MNEPERRLEQKTIIAAQRLSRRPMLTYAVSVAVLKSISTIVLPPGDTTSRSAPSHTKHPSLS